MAWFYAAEWPTFAPPLTVYALGGGGGAGVRHMLQLVEAEMRVAMALTGKTHVAAIDRSVLIA